MFKIFSIIIYLYILTNVNVSLIGYHGNCTAIFDVLAQKNTHASIFIDDITFDSDVALNKKEFLYLTELTPKSFITQQDIHNATKNILLKRRFDIKEINIIENTTTKKKILHLSLASLWIFKRLIFDGISFGRQKYASFYTLRPGDVFAINTHENAIKSIKNDLYNHGFFHAKVTDEIIYNQKNKTILIHLILQKGPCFFIKNITVLINTASSQLATIDIEGIKNSIQEKITTAVKNTRYSKKILQHTIKKIKSSLAIQGFTTPLFTLTRILKQKKPAVDLVCKIILGPQRNIIVHGNSFLNTSYIRSKFINNDLPQWFFSANIISQKLLNTYHDNGYWNTIITHKTIANNFFDFTITENKPTIIDNIEIINTHDQSQEKIAAYLTHDIQHKRFEQKKINSFLSQLKSFYLSMGFWDITITRQHFIKSDVTNNYTMQIYINKGLQRLLGDCTINKPESLKNVSLFEVYNKHKISTNAQFNYFWIQEQQSLILSSLYKSGYWYAQATPNFIQLDDVNKHNLSTKVSLKWDINPGPQVCFGNTIIRGITNVSFDQLKNQLNYTDGELFNRHKLEQIRNRLTKLDVFKSIQVQPYGLSSNTKKKPIIITVIDDEPVELRARLGYFLNSSNIFFKDQSTPKIGSSFIIKNPTHRADKISISGDWTKFDRIFNINYQLPSPYNISATSFTQGFAQKYTHPVQVENSGAAYQAIYYGFSTGLNNQYKKNCTWQIALGNEWLKILKTHGNLNFDSNLINVTLPHFFLDSCFEIDNVDNRINTTKGSLQNISLKFMLPEFEGQLIAKLVFTQSLFYPIYNNIILAGYCRFGYIFNRTFDKILPPERFYLGGPSSVRGYEPNTLPPLGALEIIKNNTPITLLTVQGGSSMINASIELRFPLYNSFGGVLFHDIGILSQSGIKGFKNTWYPGTGFGFRYKTPIGAIRFDIGWKWKQQVKSKARPYAWYLTIGEAF